MTTPALNASGEYAVVYDVGGQALRVIGGEALLHSLTLSEEESILCATINEDGWVAVTSKVSGYKGVVTVYNQNFETVMTIRLSSRYISDAIVTPDCQGVYLISPGQAEGSFELHLLIQRDTYPHPFSGFQCGALHPQCQPVLDPWR